MARNTGRGSKYDTGLHRFVVAKTNGGSMRPVEARRNWFARHFGKWWRT